MMNSVSVAKPASLVDRRPHARRGKYLSTALFNISHVWSATTEYAERYVSHIVHMVPIEQFSE